MKRILILTILLMSSLAWAGSTTVVVGQGGGAGGGGCSGSYGNNSTADATYKTMVNGYPYIKKVTLDCAGTPASINFRCNLMSTDNSIVFMVYADDRSGGGPATRVWYSGTAIGDTSTGIKTYSDTSINCELSAGSYWIGVVAGAIIRMYESDSSPDTQNGYLNNSGFYPTPPATTAHAYGDDTDEDYEIWLTF